MGILSWLRSDTGKTKPREELTFVSRADFDKRREELGYDTQIKVTLPGPDTYSFDIVGESHYQKALKAICGERTADGANHKVIAVLILDDDNPYDSKAVRVDISGETVGHLSKKFAREYRKALKKTGNPDANASCRAVIVGGWDRGGGDRGSFGVKLDLPTD